MYLLHFLLSTAISRTFLLEILTANAQCKYANTIFEINVSLCMFNSLSVCVCMCHCVCVSPTLPSYRQSAFSLPLRSVCIVALQSLSVGVILIVAYSFHLPRTVTLIRFRRYYFLLLHSSLLHWHFLIHQSCGNF